MSEAVGGIGAAPRNGIVIARMLRASIAARFLRRLLARPSLWVRKAIGMARFTRFPAESYDERGRGSRINLFDEADGHTRNRLARTRIAAMR
jgi:hypothetical protein